MRSLTILMKNKHQTRINKWEKVIRIRVENKKMNENEIKHI